jgi:16S rRNA (guanine527-N7)-methyltransferase
MKGKKADEEIQGVSMNDWRLVADEPLLIPNLLAERRLLVLTPVRKSPL